MHSSVTDAFDARLRAESYERGLPALELSYVAPAGPRQMQACVKISYEGQYPLEFRSRALWPTGQNFEAAVRAGILDVVVESGRAIVGGIFTLDSVKVDEVEATEIAFRLVSQEAT